MFALPSPIEEIKHALLNKHGVELFIKRDDLIHPEISGNKWRKLKYNIKEAQRTGFKKILTFGGAYSNHIAATAVAANYFGLQSTGIIRGEELTPESNETLKKALKCGMELKFVPRGQYRKLRENVDHLRQEFGSHFIIPEGGKNSLGILGVGELITEIDQPFDTLISPIGTGTTLTGLSSGMESGKVLGFSCLKGAFILDEIRKLHLDYQIPLGKYKISIDYHFGGYGKTTPELINFINRTYEEIGILLDPIYTGKAFFGVWELMQQGIFDGQTLIFLHTGGLQGIAGFNQKSPQKIHI